VNWCCALKTTISDIEVRLPASCAVASVTTHSLMHAAVVTPGRLRRADGQHAAARARLHGCAALRIASAQHNNYLLTLVKTFAALHDTAAVEFGVITSFAYQLEDGSGEIVVATTRYAQLTRALVAAKRRSPCLMRWRVLCAVRRRCWATPPWRCIRTTRGANAARVLPEVMRPHASEPLWSREPNSYKSMHGKFVLHPFLDRRIPIVTDGEAVDMSFGACTE
jgi:valyl-tRNA synthetase